MVESNNHGRDGDYGDNQETSKLKKKLKFYCRFQKISSWAT